MAVLAPTGAPVSAASCSSTARSCPRDLRTRSPSCPVSGSRCGQTFIRVLCCKHALRPGKCALLRSASRLCAPLTPKSPRLKQSSSSTRRHKHRSCRHQFSAGRVRWHPHRSRDAPLRCTLLDCLLSQRSLQKLAQSPNQMVGAALSNVVARMPTCFVDGPCE